MSHANVGYFDILKEEILLGEIMPLKSDEGQLLEVLGLKEDQIKAVLDEQKKRFALRDAKKPAGSTFAGQIAADLDLITQEELQAGLNLQAKQYAQAAVDDLKSIAKSGQQEAKRKENGTLQSTPFWDMNAKADVTIEGAAQRSAHMGRTMALLANEKGDKLLAAKLLPHAEAAKELADVLADPKAAAKFDKEKMIALREKAIQGLKLISKETGVKLNRDGKEITIEQYTDQLRESIENAYIANQAKQAALGIQEVGLASNNAVNSLPRDSAARTLAV